MTKEFWKDTAYRCLWTFAEAMLGCITIGQTLTEIKWVHALSVSAVATIVCLLKQIAKNGDTFTDEMTEEDGLLALEESEYLQAEIEEIESEDEEDE